MELYINYLEHNVFIRLTYIHVWIILFCYEITSRYDNYENYHFSNANSRRQCPKNVLRSPF